MVMKEEGCKSKTDQEKRRKNVNKEKRNNRSKATILAWASLSFEAHLQA